MGKIPPLKMTSSRIPQGLFSTQNFQKLISTKLDYLLMHIVHTFLHLPVDWRFLDLYLPYVLSTYYVFVLLIETSLFASYQKSVRLDDGVRKWHRHI